MASPTRVAMQTLRRLKEIERLVIGIAAIVAPELLEDEQPTPPPAAKKAPAKKTAAKKA